MGRGADGGAPRRRTGPADLVAVLLLVTAAASLVVAVVLPLNQLTQPGGSVPVVLAPPAAEQLLARADGVPAGSSLSPGPDGTTVLLDVAELSAPLRLLTELPTSVRALGAAVVAVLLWQLLTSIRGGRPFDRRNPRRVAVLAGAVLLAGVGGQLLEAVSRMTVLAAVDVPPGSAIEISAVFDATPLALGVLLLALADAFRRGVRLTDEVEGLV